MQEEETMTWEKAAEELQKNVSNNFFDIFMIH